jgi:hypothetical protein
MVCLRTTSRTTPRNHTLHTVGRRRRCRPRQGGHCPEEVRQALQRRPRSSCRPSRARCASCSAVGLASMSTHCSGLSATTWRPVVAHSLFAVSTAHARAQHSPVTTAHESEDLHEADSLDAKCTFDAPRVPTREGGGYEDYDGHDDANAGGSQWCGGGNGEDQRRGSSLSKNSRASAGPHARQRADRARRRSHACCVLRRGI